MGTGRLAKTWAVALIVVMSMVTAGCGDSGGTQVVGPIKVKDVSVGESGVVAVGDDGTVWELKAESRSYASTERMQHVRGIDGVEAVSRGDQHTLALKADGTVWAWGSNIHGQLGDGSLVNSTLPMKVAGLDNVVAVTAGTSHSMALKSDGTVWAWGTNAFGQLGDGVFTGYSSVPVEIAGLTNVVAVDDTPMLSAALKADGTLWSWGHDIYWQPDGTFITSNTKIPTEVAGLDTIVAVDGHMALKADGTVWEWAVNTAQHAIPGFANIASISAGSGHTVALDTSGSLWAAGDNRFEQLTEPDLPYYTYSNNPVRVMQTADIAQAVAGGYHTAILRHDGSLHVWGLNKTRVPTYSFLPVQVFNLNSVASISAGGSTSAALGTDGTVRAWGDIRSLMSTYTPRGITGFSEITNITTGSAHMAALAADGTVWTVGENTYGQLGTGSSATFSSTPVQVSGLADIKAIDAMASTTLALTHDGVVWQWGESTMPEFRASFVTPNFVPSEVAGLTNVTAIASGGSHRLALKADGTVWAWGWNAFGQLGDSTFVDSTAPVQAAGLTNVTAIAAGWNYSLAMKDDGTVWAWGINDWQQLGDGTTVSRPTPMQVMGLPTITAISAGAEHPHALAADGSVWSWGLSSLCLHEGSPYETIPGRLAGISNVTAIAVGKEHALALRSDGAVWAWGSNTYGTLGMEAVVFGPTELILH